MQSQYVTIYNPFPKKCKLKIKKKSSNICPVEKKNLNCFISLNPVPSSYIFAILKPENVLTK